MTLPKEPIFKPTRSDEVFGSLKYARPPKTIEEMNAGLVAEAQRLYARWRVDESDDRRS